MVKIKGFKVVNSFQFSIFVLLGTPRGVAQLSAEVVNSFQFSIFVLLGTPPNIYYGCHKKL